MRKLFVPTMMAAILSMSGCSSPEAPRLSGTGTVRYLSLEGGFYGILADDGTHLDPVNLPAEFRTDGLRVHYDAQIKPEAVSVHMWGQIVVVLSIRPILPVSGGSTPR